MWLAIVAVLLVMLALYVRGLAGRLDRLHLRVEAAMAVLDARFLRRAALARELGLRGYLDPASSVVLLDATSAVQQADADLSDVATRDATESDLSATLRAVLENADVVQALERDDESRNLLRELARTTEAVVLARRFANDAARAVIDMRRRWLVRVLRLAGHAPLPESRDLDDAPPVSLAEFAQRAA
jgi:hypothetical protein